MILINFRIYIYKKIMAFPYKKKHELIFQYKQ